MIKTNNINKTINNHRLSNLIYSNQSVVLLLYLLPLIITSQFFNKISFLLTGVAIFLVSLTVDKILNDNFIKLKKLAFIAIAIAISTTLLLPSPLPVESQQNAIISGTVYNIKGKNVDIKVHTYNQKPFFPPAKIRIYTDINLQIADKIVLKAELQEPSAATNPGQFNYKSYLYQKGINYVCYEPNIMSVKNQFSIKKKLQQLRVKMLQPAKNLLSEQTYSIYSAMILGEKSNIDKEIYAYFQGAGLSHILVISGLHLSLLTMCLIFLLTRLKVSQKKGIAITLVFIWLYALATGFSVSIIRASLMLTIFLIAKAFYQVHKPLNTLCSVAIIMIVTNPLIISNLSWQLSFTATAGIIIIMPIVNNYFGYKKLVSLIGSVIAVQLVSLPIIANSFNMIALYAIPANLICTPIVILILVLGILSLVPFVGFLALYPLSFILKLSFNLAKFFCTLPLAQISLKKWSLIFTTVYLLSLIIVIILIKLRKKKATIVVLTIVVALVTMLVVNTTGGLQITFLDVEQGDSAVLHWNSNYVMVIDGGQNNDFKNYGERVVVPYLRHAGINKINALVVSHSDNDHIGGLITVAEKFEVQTLYMSPQAYYQGSELSQKLIEICRKKGTVIEQLAENDIIKISPSSFVQVYSPEDYLSKDSNNNSLVLRVVYGNTSVLFTGDIEKETEHKLIEKYQGLLQSQILKIPHHGSKTSSTQQFLNAVKPNKAIFSLGRYNRFGHPHRGVVERYENKQIELWRTDYNGAIMLYTDGFNTNINCYLRNKK